MTKDDSANQGSGLASRLVLEERGADRFRGHPGPARGRAPGRVFGGLALAQAFAAAARTAPDCELQSLHAHFLSPARYGEAIGFEVERLREGVSLDVRSVLARQRGEAVCHVTFSFGRESSGRRHDDRCPAVPGPDGLPEIRGRWGALAEEIELRLIPPAVGQPFGLWMRPRTALPEDGLLHHASFIYASDGPLVAAAARALGIAGATLRAASIDHALWIHGPARFDDWHVFLAESPVSHAETAWAVGALYDRTGRRVASVAQAARIQAFPGGSVGPAEPNGA
ncbi:MAG: hypothetical protein GY937_14595 [bacterium]|nr:hypothetical protein [bacterium]MCP5057931.1 hypothetical protein [bacterium]